MKIALGCDHGGFALKEHLKDYMTQKGITVTDMGCHNLDSCDYPIMGRDVALQVADGTCELGVVICTTGIGISIAANKVRGIRCALCHEPMSATLCRQHNNANVLSIGAGVTGTKLAEEILNAFLAAQFEGGRHARRVDLIATLEH